MTQVDWNSLAAESRKNSLFLHVYPGARYKIRVLGDMPWEFAQHWFDVRKDKKAPYNCAGVDCMACKRGHKAVTRFLLPVLVRDRKGAENFEPFGSVLSFGRVLFNAFRDYRFEPDFGDLRQFDFFITRPEKIQPYMRTMEIMPAMKDFRAPLSEKEEKIVSEFMQSIDLQALSKPATNKDMLKAIGQKGIFNKDYR